MSIWAVPGLKAGCRKPQFCLCLQCDNFQSYWQLGNFCLPYHLGSANFTEANRSRDHSLKDCTIMFSPHPWQLSPPSLAMQMSLPNRLMPNTLKWGLIPLWNNRTLANSLMCRDRVIVCDSIRHSADQSMSTLCSVCSRAMWDIVTLRTERGTIRVSLCWICSWRQTRGSINTHLSSPVCLFTPPFTLPSAEMMSPLRQAHAHSCENKHSRGTCGAVISQALCASSESAAVFSA